MIAQIFEFVGNHWILCTIFFVLLVAFFVNEGKRGGATITSSTLVNLINKEGATILDVRDSKEYGSGHITGAINVPYAAFDGRASELDKYKEKPMVVVCKMGQHSGSIGRKLLAQGFSDVRRLSGGMSDWQASNLPLVK
jgi:rhodanese-related sulfurtransferase